MSQGIKGKKPGHDKSAVAVTRFRRYEEYCCFFAVFRIYWLPQLSRKREERGERPEWDTA